MKVSINNNEIRNSNNDYNKTHNRKESKKN
jgi:hypothetical protein